MRRSFVISDFFNRLLHVVKRNRVPVLLYGLAIVAFVAIGVAVGVRIEDKIEYIGCNNNVIFAFLRGDSGVIGFFFADLFITIVYVAFAGIMIFHRIATLLSVMPCLYLSYELGVQTCVILSVYSVSAMPMLLVFYLPICLVEICITCYASCRAFFQYSLCGGIIPSKYDVQIYIKSTFPILVIIVICAVVKALTIMMFGTGLIGII